MAYVKLSAPPTIGNVTPNTGEFTTVGVGAAAVTSALYVNAANRIGAWITGNNVSSGSDADGIFVDCSFNPSANVTNAASIGLYPTFAPPVGVAITTGYGLYIASGTQGGAGTVTTGYGLYVTSPTFGSANFTANIGGLVVNSGGTGTISAGVWNGTAVTVAHGGTGQVTLTNHGVLVGAATSAITQLSVGTNGQVLIGATAADPAFATLTSSDSSISFTTGANTLSLQVAGGSTTIKTITGNSGGAESPSAGNFNILGTGSITVAGSANTETIQLTGLTNHALQIGAGTATLTQLGAGTTGQILQTNTTADPTWSTATYPSVATGTGTILRADGTNWVATTATYPATTTINQLLYSSSNNVIAGLSTANRGVLTTGATGIPVITALATDGQLIIGSTAGAPAAASLSAGSGISITPGSNSITIAATGAAGLAWTDVTGASQTIVAGNGYLSDRAGAVAFTLPASGTIGDIFAIVGVQGSWNIVQNANQQIKFGSSATTVGATGSIASTNAGDCIECVATNTSASTVWRVRSSVGNLTVT